MYPISRQVELSIYDGSNFTLSEILVNYDGSSVLLDFFIIKLRIILESQFLLQFIYVISYE